jgi:hypothetical protein
MSEVESSGAIAARFSQKLATQYPQSTFWPRFLFHYADIYNAISIVSENAIFSRNQAKIRGLQQIDSAESKILSNTDSRFLDFARLYFRPRTPPLYRIEGFRPQLEGKPHCPVPIYFLFEWRSVFGLSGVEFSDRNLASPQSKTYSDPNDLGSLNFDRIYHTGPMPNNNLALKDAIRKSRCAEVIVPDKLPLQNNLSYIICRSVAERETLLSMMSTEQRAQHLKQTIVTPACFHRHRHFVESVALTPDAVRFSYAMPQRLQSHRYNYYFEYSGRKYPRRSEKPISDFTFETIPGEYIVRLLIDDHIAYSGAFYPVSEPF